MTAITVPHSIVALVFYALWALVLVLMIAADRTLLVLKGEMKNNAFASGIPHGTESYWRINRAHINTVENLPIFAAIVLAAWVAGMETAVFNLLATIVVSARIVQSIAHIVSGSQPATWLRTLAFAVQVVCEIWMAVLILIAVNIF
jgi:uncharacterized MAPEG superfamily protein